MGENRVYPVILLSCQRVPTKLEVREPALSASRMGEKLEIGRNPGDSFLAYPLTIYLVTQSLSHLAIIFINFSTSSGSNWVPAHLRISASAAGGLFVRR